MTMTDDKPEQQPQTQPQTNPLTRKQERQYKQKIAELDSVILSQKQLIASLAHIINKLDPLQQAPIDEKIATDEILSAVADLLKFFTFSIDKAVKEIAAFSHEQPQQITARLLFDDDNTSTTWMQKIDAVNACLRVLNSTS